MKQIQYRKLLGVLFSFIIFFFMISFFLTPKKSFSENENRYLEKMPKFEFETLINGEFVTNLQSYLNDHFPFRDFFMNLNTKVERFLGKEEMNHVYYGSDGYLLEKYDSPKNYDKIGKVLNQFYADKNYANMSLMLVPTSITINQEKLPNYAPTYDQVKEMHQLYEQIKFDTIDVTEALTKGNEEYQMFYRLDHHWTSYGAYYAYKEYCKMNDITPLDISEFEIKEVTNDFKGTLYSKVLDNSLKPDKIHIFLPKSQNYEVNYVMTNRITDTLYEESYLTKKDKYSYFLDNNQPLITITNKDLHNQKELLVIKDSYANSMIPFLVNHYEKVHVIDPRFYKLSIEEYMEQNINIKDVLILYNMNTLDTDLGIRTIH